MFGDEIRYFRDDDDVTLDEMVAKEKLGGENFDDHFARNVAKNSSWKQPGADDFDELTGQEWGKPNKKKHRDRQDRNQKQKAVQGTLSSFFKLNDFVAHNNQNRMLSQCWFCMENPNMDRSLLISLGEYTYLALPRRGAFSQGHCLIIPMGHVMSCTTVDEKAETEIAVRVFVKVTTDILRCSSRHLSRCLRPNGRMSFSWKS